MIDSAQFLISSAKAFFDSLLSDWGVIGYGIIAVLIVRPVIKFIKRFL